jgi:hypothetical protein
LFVLEFTMLSIDDRIVIRRAHLPRTARILLSIWWDASVKRQPGLDNCVIPAPLALILLSPRQASPSPSLRLARVEDKAHPNRRLLPAIVADPDPVNPRLTVG